MLPKHSPRRKSKELFQKVITLRKLGHSYSEIIKQTNLAKSTINNWLTYSGLTLSKEHLQIQNVKRVQNHVLGTEASKITRGKRKDADIQHFLSKNRCNFKDPLFISGIMLYEAEGSKGESNGFSNSDFRLIRLYLKFLEKYVETDKNKNLTFRLYIHESRNKDLARIINFWSRKIGIDKKSIRISWKHNTVSKRRINTDYVGQFEVRVKGISHFTSKILTTSDIILTEHSK